MFRNSNTETNASNMHTSTQSGFCNVNIMKELYETSTPLTSPSTSSTTSSDGNLYQAQQFQFDNMCSTSTAVSTNFESSPTLQQMSNSMQLLQQQQQYLLEQEAQKQIDLAFRDEYEEENEITKSLRLFGMVQGRKKSAIPANSELLLDTVMEEFDCNGYTCDDLNRYQQYRTAAIQLAKKNDVVELTNEQFNRLQQYELLCQSGGISSYNNNVNLNDVRNKLRMMLPSSRQGGQNGPSTMRTPSTSASSSATSVAFANMDFNSTKKPYKRYPRGGVEKQPAKHCVFCENNNEPEAVVKSHAVRDSLGRVLCPKLRTYICPICKASGDFAHTVKYCPQKPIITMEDAIKAEAYRQSKNYYTQKKSNFIY